MSNFFARLKAIDYSKNLHEEGEPMEAPVVVSDTEPEVVREDMVECPSCKRVFSKVDIKVDNHQGVCPFCGFILIDETKPQQSLTNPDNVIPEPKESISEEGEENTEATEIAPEAVPSYVKETVIRYTIADEQKAIADYRERAALANNAGDTETAAILNELADDETVHVGTLEKLLYDKGLSNEDKVVEGMQEKDEIVPGPQQAPVVEDATARAKRIVEEIRAKNKQVVEEGEQAPELATCANCGFQGEEEKFNRIDGVLYCPECGEPKDQVQENAGPEAQQEPKKQVYESVLIPLTDAQKRIVEEASKIVKRMHEECDVQQLPPEVKQEVKEENNQEVKPETDKVEDADNITCYCGYSAPKEKYNLVDGVLYCPECSKKMELKEEDTEDKEQAPEQAPKQVY